MLASLRKSNRFPIRILFTSLVAILFAPTLATASGVHPLFNVQSTAESPFPSDRFTVDDSRQLTGLRVNLPSPNCSSNPSDCNTVSLLNQLDGFGTDPRISIPFNGAIDLSTVNSSTVFLLRVVLPTEEDGTATVTQNVGINQVVWDPDTLTLYARPDLHLDEDATYLLVVTRGVRDAAGDPVEASDDFAQFRHDLNFGQTKDRRLKLYRKTLITTLDDEALATAQPALSHEEIAAASFFTTGSVSANLEKIRDIIKAAPAPVANFNIGLQGQRTVFPRATVQGINYGRQIGVAGPLSTIPTPITALLPTAVGTIAFGKFSSMNFETANRSIPAVPTRTGVPQVQSTQDLYFNLFLPVGPRPANGWPVAIFGHGFGDNKNNSPMAVAATLANSGIATLSINAVGHGNGPNGTLTVLRSTGAVVLPAGGRGADLNGNNIIESTEGFFGVGAATDVTSRDGLTQTVADLMQVVRTIQGGVDVDGNGSVALDASRIYYLGQSLGGIYGTILLGVEPDIHQGVLNVPGGSMSDIGRIGPSFRPLLAARLAPRVPSLINVGVNDFDDNMPLRNQPPVVNTVPGATAIQQYEDWINWLSQSGDPLSWAPFIRKSPLSGQSAKDVIVQIARGDKTVPNPANTALIRAGELTDRTTFFRNDLAFPLNVGFSKNPHTFLTDIALAAPVRQAAFQAQTQAAVFFASGGATTIDPDGAGLLYETPINGPLPEDLAFIP